MNISSIVVKVLPEESASLIEVFKNSDFCEFHHYENGNIIVTIEGEDVDSEVGKMRQIEETPHVISASLVYSYLEDEIKDKVESVDKSKEMPEWLNDDNVTAKDIKYGGSIRRKY